MLAERFRDKKAACNVACSQLDNLGRPHTHGALIDLTAMSTTTSEKGPYAGIPALLSYCVSSIFMTLVNKFVLSGFTRHPVFLMLAIQAAACVLLIRIFGALGMLKCRSLNLRDVRTWFPISALMALMLYTGGKSLQYLTVPLFTIFKNLTIILVAYGEKLVFGSTVTPLMLFSFAVMVLSSVVGGWTDITFDPTGYFWMAANCCSSALFVLGMRKAIKLVDFQDFDTVYFNNALTMPIFLVMSIIAEDWPDFFGFYSDPANSAEAGSMMCSMVLSGCGAFGISFTSAWCIRVTNSTTYSMVGALNKLPIAIAGMIFFGNIATVGNVVSIMLGFAAGLLYSWSKVLQKRQAAMLPMSMPMKMASGAK